MFKEGCVFCYKNVPKNEIFYEDIFFYARLDRFPGVSGHAEVIPKRHVENLFDLTNREKAQYLFSIENASTKLKKLDLEREYKKMKPFNNNSKEFIKQILKNPNIKNISKIEEFLHGVNDGKNAGQSIPHLHWHIIPAFPGLIKSRGIRNAIINDKDYTK